MATGGYQPAGPGSDLLRYFEFDHLPDGALRNASRPFHELAYQLWDMLPGGPEKTVALRKLLEAKDAAVRSALDIEEIRPPSAGAP